MDKKTVSAQEYFKNSNYSIDEYNLANLFNVVDIDKKSYYNITKTIKFIKTKSGNPTNWIARFLFY